MTNFTNEFQPVIGNIVSDRTGIKIQVDLSIQHIQSAALYSRLCAKIENDYNQSMRNSTEFDDLPLEHRAHAISSVLASVAFLEATVNKFFADEVEHLEETINFLFANVADPINSNSSIRNILDYPATKLVMADMLKSAMAEKDRKSILAKFDDVITSVGKQGFDKGAAPYQDVSLLINLRNALVHYKPKWITILAEDITADEFDDKKIVILQKEHKFPLNPLMDGIMTSFFPNKCLGHGCASWAVKSSIQFIEEFYQRMNIPFSINHFQFSLRTEP